MTIHQCPKCELRFSWNTELDNHLREDHPQFRHDYPVGHPNHPGEIAQAGKLAADEFTDRPHTSLAG